MQTGSLTISWVEHQLVRHVPRVIPDSEAPRRAAVAILLRDAPRRGCCDLLFIRRSQQSDDPWSGHMAFPGGGVEPADASALHAALRETREEVAIDLGHNARLLGQLDDVRASARGRVLPMAISPYVFHVTGAVAPEPNVAEVEEIHWVSVLDLLDPTCASTVSYHLGSEHLSLPCFRVADRTIWGLTYQMLMQLFALLRWEPNP